MIRPIELFSMAAIVGLIAGSILVGGGIYKRAVPCSVVASRADLIIVADGRDSGARTQKGEAPLRLRPGHHRVSLLVPHRPGEEVADAAPRAPVEIDVRPGDACVVRFDEPSAEAAEPAEPAEGAR
jgi:2-polyprenyl-6-methoxyphenol hydroxylase-like FAD-dependent oxidoreductase